jgi:hypothetical protein
MLPIDVIAKVLSFLPLTSRISCSGTSKDWHIASQFVTECIDINDVELNAHVVHPLTSVAKTFAPDDVLAEALMNRTAQWLG